MRILVILLLSFCFNLNAKNQKPLIHNPVINHQGNIIAFTYQGDIWIAAKDGSNPKRLTIHEAYDSNPLFNSDDSQIVFQSNRFGNNDIFVIPVNGGIPKRLTYSSANDILTDVTPNNKALFCTKRNFSQVEAEQEIFEVSLNGGTPKRIMNSLGFDATLSPNGKLIAFTKGSCRITREEYRGSANRDIWVYNIEKNTYHQITTFNGNDFSPVWGGNNILFFQSARSGKYNVHKATLNDNDEVKKIDPITHFEDFGIFSYQLGNHHSTIVVSQMDKLFLVDVNTKKVTPLSIEINADYRLDLVETKIYTKDVYSIMPSPNGKYSLLTIRGEIFLTENEKKKKRTVNLTNSPYRDHNAFWLNDETVIFTSDRNGVQNLFKITSSDPDQKDIFCSLKHTIVQLTFSDTRIDNPSLSPNQELLAYTQGRGKLIVSEISKKGELTNEVILNDNGWSLPSDISWSPDSKWVAYTLQDLEFNSEIFIQKVDNSIPATNISMHPKGDHNPVWSDDGTKIGFTSNRNNSDYDVWFVWLQRENWEKTTSDWEESSSEEPDKETIVEEKKKKERNKKTSPVIIDLEDIYERQVQVTNYSGGEFLQGISKDGKTFYYTTGNGTRTNIDVTSDLFKIKWDGKDKKALTLGNSKPSAVQLDREKEYLYFTLNGKPHRIKLARGEANSSNKTNSEEISFSAKMEINYPEERNQIFEDAWLAINDGFYDPHFHEHDWNLLKTQFKPLAMKASTSTDFKFIFNWMLGQINASHMGMYGGEKREDLQQQRSGQLGIEVYPLEDGTVKIVSVTPGMPADKVTSTLEPGSIITAVNGEKLTPSVNYYSFLNGKADEKIYLSVITPKGKSSEIIIRPDTTNRVANYTAWVKERKRLTHLYSGGKLGYIHIQGMNWTSFERFEREITAAGYGKEGIVIDVRYNGGGWTTDYLMAVLNVKQHAYTIPRGAAADLKKEHANFKENYPYSERLPLAAWTKPSIALCNERSYSNAEIFSHAYKSLKIGTLVGQPTFGAVISTGSHRLIDGSYVRMPYRGWFVKNTGANMDKHPAVPDILVKNAPDEKAKQQDTQLKTAVEELLRQINTNRN
ncbi:S41 family peptidase [Abyssalbus ytuae]|uniref:Tricorn protease homolog n=1 Tax=Abyssalbus ytuae TaxID=2926907 RepID=A0A9E6ZQW0_9FLAO|nr:S41 family peptidase [Abyssalbus ytuae]UOB17133.1 S41 family peptidase [Abyssalbus ytuae]